MGGILVWVPVDGQPHWPCVTSWLAMKTPNNCGFTFVRTPPDSIENAWNSAVRGFLKTDLEWMLSTHNDVVFAPDSLLRLMSWGKKLVSGLVFSRHPPHFPFCYGPWVDDTSATIQIRETFEWIQQHEQAQYRGPQVLDPCPAGALIEVAFASTSFLLIHRDVLAAIEPPWFYRDGSETRMGGEDRWFFKKAAEKGFTGYLDRSVLCSHLPGDDVAIDAVDFITWTSVISDVQQGVQDGNSVIHNVA